MNQKPKEILEIEQYLGIKLSEVYTQDGVMGSKDSFFLDENRKIVGLNLSFNSIKDISFLWRLESLKYLNFRNNQVNDISPLKELKNLQELYFMYNWVSSISPLKELKNLQTLYFWYNKISDISPLKELKNLSKPYKVRVIEMCLGKEVELRKVHTEKEMMKGDSTTRNTFLLNENKEIIGLDFSSNQVSDVSFLYGLNNLKYLKSSANQVNNISPLKELRNLQTLNLGGNKISDISHLKELSNLQTLDLGGNKISDISHLKELSNLQTLDLRGNKISDISHLKELSNLQELYFEYNLVDDIPSDFILFFPKLKKLRVYGNPLPKIPKEIIQEYNCIKPFFTYLRDLELDKSPNNEVKIILIGNGSVGKTQIARRLSWNNEDIFVLNEKHDSTHAIDLHKKNLKCSFLENGLDLNIWDFGGQDIYHATHRLFMKTRALFILIWDVENEKEDSQHEYKGVKYDNFPLRYWLEYAKYFGKESPVLVVRNKTDIHGKEFEMPKGLKESYQTEYPSIVGFVEVSAKTGDNFYGLEKQIQKTFEENENLRNDLINKQLPTAWVRMRNKIREEQQKESGLQQISKEIFQEWCKKELIPDSAPTLLDFFHQTGVFFYNEEYFSGQIILDQSWAISAVYKVLDKDAAYFGYLQEQQGKLNYGDICEIWQEYTDSQRELFLGFMLSCELCFETTENKKYDKTLKDRTFVVPQLLHKEMNFALKNALPSLSLTENETKKYAFLPTSLIQRFIIKAHSLAKIEDIWQKGILLHHENAFALVEAFYGREPYLQIHYNKEAKFGLVPAIWAEFYKLEGKEKVVPHQERDFMENIYWQGLDSLILPNKSITRKEIETHFQKGEIEKVIDLLLDYYDKKELDLYTEVSRISARFHKNEYHLHKGIILQVDYNVEWSKINDAILYILKKF